MAGAFVVISRAGLIDAFSPSPPAPAATRFLAAWETREACAAYMASAHAT